MSTPQFEAFLARLYTDQDARAKFLRDRLGEAKAAGLTTEQADSLAAIDEEALQAAARSFTRKREHKQRHAKHSWFR